jgi:hypothetical protein
LAKGERVDPAGRKRIGRRSMRLSFHLCRARPRSSAQHAGAGGGASGAHRRRALCAGLRRDHAAPRLVHDQGRPQRACRIKGQGRQDRTRR